MTDQTNAVPSAVQAAPARPERRIYRVTAERAGPFLLQGDKVALSAITHPCNGAMTWSHRVNDEGKTRKGEAAISFPLWQFAEFFALEHAPDKSTDPLTAPAIAKSAEAWLAEENATRRARKLPVLRSVQDFGR